MNEPEECNKFTLDYQKHLTSCQVVVYSATDYLATKNPPSYTLIIGDIGTLDDKIRRSKSVSLDITNLIELTIQLIQEKQEQERIIHALSLIAHIYTSIPSRPT